MRDGVRDAGSHVGEETLTSLRMWGYLPAASSQRLPLLLPTPVPPPPCDASLKIVCHGGCGFALAISESGKLNTWGSTTDLGQCYLISGKQQEFPEPYPLRTDHPVVQAAAGWAHCAAVTETGEVFTWGWSECVPNVKTNSDEGDNIHGEEGSPGTQNTTVESTPQENVVVAFGKASSSASPLGSTGGSLACSKQAGRAGNRNVVSRTSEHKGVEEVLKKRKVVSFEDGGSPEDPPAAEENVFSPPCVVSLDSGIRIKSVAAGGRHTLALSDGGRVWGWGYGGEGQLGLGSRMRIVSSPQCIPCFNPSGNDGKRSEKMSGGLNTTVPENFIKAIACGGRHSALVTDGGALLTFGWGLYGQVGQGSTEDQLSPCYVATMGGLHVAGVAAGLWHTLCITDVGDVYAFGGNQFGQLGVGGSHAEMSPRLIESPLLEDETMVSVTCGARHSAALTETGKVFTWGWNRYGQLGLGDNNNRDLPVQVTMSDGGRVASVACGWWHTLAAVHASKV